MKTGPRLPFGGRVSSGAPGLASRPGSAVGQPLGARPTDNEGRLESGRRDRKRNEDCQSRFRGL